MTCLVHRIGAGIALRQWSSVDPVASRTLSGVVERRNCVT